MPKRKRILESASFHEGDIVTVYNQTLAGKPIIEGQAAIVGPGDVADQYRVRFRDKRTGEPERQAYLRFVYPGWSQDDPRGYLAAAQAERYATENDGWDWETDRAERYATSNAFDR